METKKNVKSNKNSGGNKKTHTCIGLFAAGVVIIASLFATFVIKRSKRKGSDSNPNAHIKGSPKFNHEDYNNRGLACVLQNPPTRSNYRGHGASSVVDDITNEDGGTDIQDSKEVHEDNLEKDITVYHSLLGFQEEDHIIIEAETPIELDVEVGIELQLAEEEKGKKDEEHIADNENEFSKDRSNSSMDLEYNTKPKLETYRLEKREVEEVQTHINSHNSALNHVTEKGMTATEHIRHSSTNICVWVLPMLMAAIVMFLIPQILFMVTLLVISNLFGMFQ